jgi:hypothetical protein
MRRLSLTLFVTICLIACQSQPEPIVNDKPVPTRIFGEWHSINYQDSYRKIRKKDKWIGENYAGWHDISSYYQKEFPDQIIFHDTTFIGHLNPGKDGMPHSDHIIEVCRMRGIGWARWESDAYRDFYLLCEDRVEGQLGLHLFGQGDPGEVLERPAHNFRIFGPGFRMLRLRFKDGNEYYFKRVD